MNHQSGRTPASSKIFVFKTSLKTDPEVRLLSEIFRNMEGIGNWSVDLDDWEKILRIESRGISSGKIVELLSEFGISCRQLDGPASFSTAIAPGVSANNYIDIRTNPDKD